MLNLWPSARSARIGYHHRPARYGTLAQPVLYFQTLITIKDQVTYQRKPLIYGPGPSRKPDSALSRLGGVRVSDHVGGCPDRRGFPEDPRRGVSV
jgi:hypothetical protein